MWKISLICMMVATGVGNANSASNKAHHHTKRQAGSYASAGSFAGSGGYGTGGWVGSGNYGGNYGGGSGNYGGYGGYAPDYSGFGYGIIDPYEFHRQLTAQILAQHALQQSAHVSTYSDGDASTTADAASMPDDIQIQQQIAQQQAFFDDFRRQNYYSNPGYSSSHRYAPNYAAAAASLNNGGYYQTAFINPANPAVPNVVNRFGGSSSPGGYKGVSTSSFSSSSDVGGKRTNHRGAQTTINDNGKVTTHFVHS